MPTKYGNDFKVGEVYHTAAITSRTRTWLASEENFKEDGKLGTWPDWPMRPTRSF
jgi:hypothetical protein